MVDVEAQKTIIAQVELLEEPKVVECAPGGA